MAEVDEQEPGAPGWDAITRSLAQIYGTQEPLHWGTLLSYRIGGPDPLDGISAYRNDGPPSHWHLITYGFSELYGKDSEFPDQSGWGFELTFRLARSPAEEQPPAWALSFLQNLARYVFSSGNALAPGHHMDLNGPIALGEATQIRAILFSQDRQLPPIDTPNGRLAFVQVVGITLDELDAAQAWRTDGMLDLVRERNPLLVTDLQRLSILADEEVAAAVRTRGRQEGSSTAVLYMSQLGWEAGRGAAGGHKIVIGAKSAGTLKCLLPNRLLHGMDLTIAGPNRQIRLSAAPEGSSSGDAEQIELRIPPAAIEPLAAAIQPTRGTYSVPDAPGLVVEVVPTSIKDHEGKVIEVIG